MKVHHGRLLFYCGRLTCTVDKADSLNEGNFPYCCTESITGALKFPLANIN